MPAYRTTFISHAHADNARCERIHTRLCARGVDAWIDLKNMQRVHALPTEITQELVQRQAFVLMVTPTSDASLWVGNELDTYLAFSLNSTTSVVDGQERMILSVVLEPVTIQFGMKVGNWAKVFGRFWIDGVGKSDEQVADEIAAAVALSSQPQQPVAPSIQPSARVALPVATPQTAPRTPIPTPMPVRPPAPPTISPDHFPQRLARLNFVGQVINGVEVITPPLCDVPAGDFLMGSDTRRDPQAFDGELPQKSIPVAAFQIAKHPVTIAEYACYQRATGKQPADWRPQPDTLDRPVDNASWKDAVAYLEWLAQTTRQPWRLPTEAEWEKAARGTDGRIYPWGDRFDPSRCNTLDENGKPSVGHTTAVGSYPSGESPYHVQDMAGNVWEWCSSLYKPYPYNKNDGRENIDSTDSRVLRGGSWDDYPQGARAAYRVWVGWNLNYDGGFRACLGRLA